MPNQPNDRYQQDVERIWPAAVAERFPAQPPYREVRSSRPLSWAGLNALPAGASARHGLNTR
ncbi:DNA repair protein [Micromonospora sp. NPDC007271]|uniref:DNA repair protein n=1 Tax=Micromonospora sp. NPDC007271 TaxID=3154587 RepID=UPI0033C32B42